MNPHNPGRGPKELRACRVELQDIEEPVLRGMRVTPLGFCLSVIVNEKPLDLERTTPSVLSVLFLIYVLNHYKLLSQIDRFLKA